jgi:ribosome biogenesis GTPase / thiamine phosphate phosphatase
LDSLGWDSAVLAGCDVDFSGANQIARVIEEQRDLYQLAGEFGEVWATLSGRMRHEGAEFPAVGDFVLARHRVGDDRAHIVQLLPRRSLFSRKAPETGREQVIAANVDVAFVVVALGDDFNIRRVERYLAAVWDSGALPVIVLTKCDLHDDLTSFEDELSMIAPGVRVLATSAHRNVGVDRLRELIGPRRTGVIVGSSGAGKSSLINRLLGREAQTVHTVSAHLDKGRHTTTARSLFVLADGSMVIDTPGMRELQFYDVDEGVARTFEDIEAIVARCRFSDCQHRTEPGCAVRVALDDNTLDGDRWKSYQKLQREAAYQQRALDSNAKRLEKARWKKISQMSRRHPHKW